MAENITVVSNLSCDDEKSALLQQVSISGLLTLLCSVVLATLVAIGGTFMNSLVLVVLWRKPSLQTNSNILLGSLAISDLIVSAVLTPCDMYRRILYINKHYDCKFEYDYYIPQVFFIGVSLYTVVLITLDRFVSLFLPYWYTSFVSRRWTLILAAMVWVTCFILQLPLIISYDPNSPKSKVKDIMGYSIFLSTILALVCVSLAYLKIYQLCRQHMRQIASVEAISEQDRRTAREAKAAKTISSVVLCLFLCYLPIMIVPFMALKCHCTSFSSRTTLIYPWVQLLLCINSFFNPILYWCKITEIKGAMKETMQSCYVKLIRTKQTRTRSTNSLPRSR